MATQRESSIPDRPPSSPLTIIEEEEEEESDEESNEEDDKEEMTPPPLVSHLGYPANRQTCHRGSRSSRKSVQQGDSYLSICYYAPSSVSKALDLPEWGAAFDKELKGLVEHKTYVEVDRPKNTKVISSHIILDEKSDGTKKWLEGMSRSMVIIIVESFK